MWSGQAPLTYVATDAGGYAKNNLAAGRGTDPGDPWFHQIVRKCLGDTSGQSCNGEFATGLYTYFDPDSMAWVTPEEILPSTDRGNDFNIVVLPDDEILVVHEYWDNGVGPKVALSRRTGANTWTQELISSSTGSAHTPQVFLQEFPDSSVLHVTFSQDYVTTLNYRRKRVSGSGGTWSTPDTVSTYLGGGAVFVDSFERPHQVTKYLDKSGDPYWLQLHHVYPDGSGWVDTVVDSFAVTVPPPLTEIEIDPVVSARGGGDDEFYVAYSAPDDDNYTRSNGEIWVSRLTVSAVDSSITWATPVVGSPDKSERAVAGQIDRTSDGVYHLTYMRPPAPGTIRRPTVDEYAGIFYRESSTPLVSSSWSPPIDVTADRTTAARNVGFARSDYRTMFTYSLFAQADPDDWWQPWYRFYDEEPDTVAANAHVEWSGLVQLAGDFYVAPAGTLSIDQGAQVIVKANTDTLNIGNQSGLTELVIDGFLDSQGTESEPVVLTSSEETSGTWGGILFRDTADMSISRIEHTGVDYPTFGIQVDSLACTLIQPTFESPLQAGIHADRDTRIPATGEWDLVAPTTVSFATSDAGGGGEDTTRVELAVDGVLRSHRPTGAAATDSVWFTSGATTPDRGDWAGITIRWDQYHSKGVLRDASIGYCTNPLAFVASDSALVEDSNLHHFTDTGIFDWGTGGYYRRNAVQGSEGVGAVEDGALLGIHSLTAIPQIEENTIGWHQISGIEVEWTKNYCADLEDSTQAPEDSVFVIGNTLTGKGEQNSDYQLGSGITVTWGCRKRHVRIYENSVEDWYENGVDLLQCADTRLKCNDLVDNKRGVSHSRNISETSGGPVRLRTNFILGSDDAGVWADDFSKLKLYDGGVFATSNEIQVEGVSTGVYVHHEDYTASVLDARHTVWRDAADQILGEADSLYVRTRIDGIEPLLVNIADFDTVAADCSGSQQLESRLQRPESVVDSGPQPAPNVPTFEVANDRDRTRVDLGLPGHDRSKVSVRVYDVSGRLVSTIVDGELPPGRHAITWAQDTNSGRPVASGIYFLVARGDSWSFVRKAVVIR
ncbi:MAG: FlgD immunoglobulin-like domain containing protein [bacterium]